MGRWGDGALDSDGSLDFFFGEIIEPMLRELSYILTLERVEQSTGWLLDVLSSLELMVLFEEQDMGSSGYMEWNIDAVNRWQTVIMPVWDGDWEDDSKWNKSPIRKQVYRVKHRQQVISYFDRLIEIGQFWHHLADDNLPDKQLTTFTPESPLPLFTGRFILTLTDQLKKEIIYTLADENADIVRGIYRYYDHIWVSVEVLGFKCETYRLSPQVTEEHTTAWERKANEIWDDYYKPLDADADWIPVSASSFQRLKDIAKQYPPRRW